MNEDSRPEEEFSSRQRRMREYFYASREPDAGITWRTVNMVCRSPMDRKQLWLNTDPTLTSTKTDLPGSVVRMCYGAPMHPKTIVLPRHGFGPFFVGLRTRLSEIWGHSRWFAEPARNEMNPPRTAASRAHAADASGLSHGIASSSWDVARVLARNPGSTAALLFVADRQPVTISELARELALSEAGAVRILSLLHSTALISLEADEQLRLAPGGRGVVARIREVLGATA